MVSRCAADHCIWKRNTKMQKSFILRLLFFDILLSTCKVTAVVAWDKEGVTKQCASRQLASYVVPRAHTGWRTGLGASEVNQKKGFLKKKGFGKEDDDQGHPTHLNLNGRNRSSETLPPGSRTCNPNPSLRDRNSSAYRKARSTVYSGRKQNIEPVERIISYAGSAI